MPQKWVDEAEYVIVPGAILAYKAKDGRHIAILPMTYGKYRIVVGPDNKSIDNSW
jgi:hypothetical protein